MQQANNLNTLELAGSQLEGMPPITTVINAGLAIFLADLPSLVLSDTGCHNVSKRFRLIKDELSIALATYITYLVHHSAECTKLDALTALTLPIHDTTDEYLGPLPIPAKEFGNDALTSAIVLTGTNGPKPAQLDASLLEMHPVGGPTAASLVAAGWLLPAIDKKGLRLPLLRMVAGASPYSPQHNGRR